MDSIRANIKDFKESVDYDETQEQIQDVVEGFAGIASSTLDDIESKVNDIKEVLEDLNKAKVVDLCDEIDALEELSKSLY